MQRVIRPDELRKIILTEIPQNDGILSDSFIEDNFHLFSNIEFAAYFMKEIAVHLPVSVLFNMTRSIMAWIVKNKPSVALLLWDNILSTSLYIEMSRRTNYNISTRETNSPAMITLNWYVWQSISSLTGYVGKPQEVLQKEIAVAIIKTVLPDREKELNLRVLSRNSDVIEFIINQHVLGIEIPKLVFDFPPEPPFELPEDLKVVEHVEIPAADGHSQQKKNPPVHQGPLTERPLEVLAESNVKQQSERLTSVAKDRPVQKKRAPARRHDTRIRKVADANSPVAEVEEPREPVADGDALHPPVTVVEVASPPVAEGNALPPQVAQGEAKLSPVANVARRRFSVGSQGSLLVADAAPRRRFSLSAADVVVKRSAVVEVEAPRPQVANGEVPDPPVAEVEVQRQPVVEVEAPRLPLAEVEASHPPVANAVQRRFSIGAPQSSLTVDVAPRRRFSFSTAGVEVQRPSVVEALAKRSQVAGSEEQLPPAARGEEQQLPLMEAISSAAANSDRDQERRAARDEEVNDDFVILNVDKGDCDYLMSILIEYKKHLKLVLDKENNTNEPAEQYSAHALNVLSAHINGSSDSQFIKVLKKYAVVELLQAILCQPGDDYPAQIAACKELLNKNQLNNYTYRGILQSKRHSIVNFWKQAEGEKLIQNIDGLLTNHYARKANGQAPV